MRPSVRKIPFSLNKANLFYRLQIYYLRVDSSLFEYRPLPFITIAAAASRGLAS